MKLERCEQSSERKRLSGQLQARGVQTGTDSVFLLLFGLPFVGVGIWATLVGAKLIPINPANLHAPYWVLAAFGIVFMIAGLLVWSMGWRQWRANRYRKQVLAEGNNDPALADYPWDPRGFTPPRWARAFTTLGFAILLGIFLSMFNWWAFFTKSPWPVKAIVGLFDMILLLLICHAVMLIGRAIKFGRSRLEYSRFPFRPGQAVLVRWLVPSGIARATKGTFTLRCVEEWFVRTQTGKNTNRTLVQEQIWSSTGHVSDLRGMLPGKTEELQFELPADVPTTTLSSNSSSRTVFWELAVDLDLSGLDFKETYLIPVYRQG